MHNQVSASICNHLWTRERVRFSDTCRGFQAEVQSSSRPFISHLLALSLLTLGPTKNSFFVISIPPPSSPSCEVAAALFAPLVPALIAITSGRSCPQHSDFQWLMTGSLRCFMRSSTGRDFLQMLEVSAPALAMHRSSFFGTLQSERRLAMCAQVNAALVDLMRSRIPDSLSCLPGLDAFAVFAADGHYHSAAAHDAPIDGAKRAVGHIFTLDLSTHALAHLVASDQKTRKHEHEIRALKRIPASALRAGVRKGKKVLMAYDGASIDFHQWHAWKQGSGIYMVSLVKANLALAVQGNWPFDSQDAHNAGVLRDELVGTATAGFLLRRITFYDACSGRVFEFLTNEMTLMPGVITQIYKMRWDIEKVFDETKNKLAQKKSWASGETPKEMQAQFICIAHNLLVLLEAKLAQEEGITNVAEAKRKSKRLAESIAIAAKQKRQLPAGLIAIQRHTQRSLKFIRWVASHLFTDIPWKVACTTLIGHYARL